MTPPPAWAHLTPASLKALLEPPGRVPQALRLTPFNVPVEAALQVPMVHAARLLLQLAVDKGGLVLTPAGALTRVLRPLTWLGLLESRKQKRHSGWGFDEDFRKGALFGQLVAFEVEMQGAEAARH